MILKKNDETEVEITAVSSDGAGIARADGAAVFVPCTAVGDRVRVRIIKAQKNYYIGKAMEITVPSKHRTFPDCPVFEKCGGCAFRHISYDEEINIKHRRVADCLSRIAKVDITPEPVVFAEQIDRYRNKAQLPIGIDKEGEIYAGFYAKKSHRIIDCGSCKLQPEEFKTITDIFVDHLKTNGISVYDEQSGKGLCRHLYIRKGFASGQTAVCAVINGERLPAAEELYERLKRAVPSVVSLSVNINRGRNNVIMGKKCVTLFGSDEITDTLCGVEFSLSPLSFYQVNSLQAQKLFTIATDLADLDENSTAVDLYCGAGAIGLIAAKRKNIKALYGVEIVPEAVENAGYNALRNGIENAHFICGDASKGAAELLKMKVSPDVVFVDPPRKGCDRETLSIAAQKMSPKRIVYVSCDPATFARDAAILKEMGYDLKKAVPVDLFPRTPHIETVGLFKRTADCV